jgi:hypothetical protein
MSGRRRSDHTPTTRPPGTAARTHERLAERHRRKADEHRAAMEQAFRELVQIHEDTEARFGVPIPRDPYLIDMLEQIDLGEAPDVGPVHLRAYERPWMWRGGTNGSGTPTVRVPRTEADTVTTTHTERTAARFLAVRFGLMRADDPHALVLGPNVDQLDVNPWKRYLDGRRLGA